MSSQSCCTLPSLQVNLEDAKTAHAEFRRVMREMGVRVLTVREILAYGADDHVGARVELEEFAMQVGGERGCCPAARMVCRLPLLPGLAGARACKLLSSHTVHPCASAGADVQPGGGRQPGRH